MTDNEPKPPADTSWLQTPEVAGAWVRRTAPKREHVCAPPMREVVYEVPPPAPPIGGWQGCEPARPFGFSCDEVDGQYGDLWRCFCGGLWRVGSSCNWGPHSGRCPAGGYHPDGLKWRPATWWQRLRYRRSM